MEHRGAEGDSSDAAGVMVDWQELGRLIVSSSVYKTECVCNQDQANKWCEMRIKHNHLCKVDGITLPGLEVDRKAWVQQLEWTCKVGGDEDLEVAE